MSQHTDWLRSELQVWLEAGLIDKATASAIAERYPKEHNTSWAMRLLSAMGAIVFGLGVILFFAYNWAEFPKFAKLGVIFSSLLLFHLLAWFIGRSKPQQHNLIEGFHLLGTMLFGAGIWLIAQIYHIDEHYPTAFLLWGIGALLIAWTLPSVIQALLATILIAAWGLSEIVDFDRVQLLSVCLIGAGIVPLAWQQRSRSLLFFSLTTLLLLAVFNIGVHINEHLIVYLILSIGTLLIALSYLSDKSSFPASADVLRTMGVISYGGTLYILTFVDTRFNELIFKISQQQQMILWWPLGLSLLAWIALLLYGLRARFTLTKSAQHVLILLTILPIVLHLSGRIAINPAAIQLLFNAILAAHCVLLIIRGTDNLQWKQVAVGCFTLAILVFARFNDLFHSLLMRSAAFLLLGAMLFVVGHFYTQRKQRSQADA